MKKSFAILLLVILAATAYYSEYLSAQTPQKINYQIVIRDNNNAIVANTKVGMKISILLGSASGTTIYTETQTPTTNTNGLVSIEVGSGAGFSAINWANNTYFIKTETDPVGGTNYIKTETSQLLSVPYALHSKKAELILSLTQTQIDTLTPVDGLMVFNTTTQQPIFYNGTQWRSVAVGTATGANKSYPTAVGLLSNNYLTEGNLDRLFAVFDKAQKGGNVVIGALGGSITEGAASTSADKRYINLVHAWWKNTFPKANITLVNAGIGATASDYGAMRVNRDLLSKSPDFVVVDYAVNDAATEPEYKLSFEGMVRQILKAPQHPAVMLLFMTTSNGVNSQDFKIPIGIQYGLPMVNYHDAIWPEVQAGQLIWSKVGADYIHPNDNGHALTADMICLALEKAYQKFNSSNIPIVCPTLPAPVFSNWYEFTSLYDGGDLLPVSNIGWTYDGSVAKSAGYRSSTPGSVLTFQLSGKVIYLSCWKTNGNAGKASVTVDGANPIIVDSWFDQTTFSYRYMLKIADNLNSGNHVVRIELLAEKNSLSTGNEFKVLCLGSAGCMDESPESKIPVQLKVYNDSVLMNDFLGVNGVYHGFAFMPEQINKGMNDDDRKREFSRIKDMDLKIARTWYRTDWACGDNMYNDFNWETEKMKAFYLWLDKMKELKVDVAIQAGWWFTKDTYPWVLGKQNDAIGPQPDKDPERFAQWVNESLNQLIKIKGYTNIKYLMLFTEPLNYPAGIIPNGYTEPEYYKKVCTAIHEKLLESGLRSELKIVGPNSGGTDTAAWVGWSVKNMDKIIDIYSWHTYNGGKWNCNPPQEYDGWRKIVAVGINKIQQTNKPFWIDEYGSNMPDETKRFKADYGNYLAQCVAAFANEGVQTSLIWLLFDQQYVAPLDKNNNKDSFYNGVHRWGLAKWPQDNVSDSESPYPSWYAYSMMSKYLGGRNQTKIFKTNSADSVIIIATKPNDKELSVMVVNTSHSVQKFKVDFQQKLKAKLERHLYDPANVEITKDASIIGCDKKICIKHNSFSDELPSRGVAIYTTLK